MAVVKPKPTRKEQNVMALEMAVGTIVGVIFVGVVAPIILAIIVGELWGH
ncbi:MAG TPA: hypothetical protein VEJ87_11730 [Acidimicrobiales bacterium]|nr:hypothetical protein [Acidimicrobiales bacterium]